MPEKRIHDMDRHIGQQIRIHRLNLGISQEKLGDALGLTFQQIQKYEKGTNRVSGSRLQQIADALNLPGVEVFFDGGPKGSKSGAAPPGTAHLNGMLSTREGQVFAKEWQRFTRRQRVALVEMVQAFPAVKVSK